MKYLIFSALFIFFSLIALCQNNAILFKRIDEPKEKALSFLVPDGWIVEGGAFRILDPNTAGVSNMVDCKFDLAVKKDAGGSVMIRWLPEIMCIDQSRAFGNPEGAVFNNSLVWRKRDPVSFIFQVAVPYAHPRASNVKMTGSKKLPELEARYASTADPGVKMYTNMSYQSALVEFTYEEDGKTYIERMVSVLEDYGNNGGGLWKNRESMLIRAQINELAKWEPVLNVIQNSGIWNLQWITGEVNGQRQRTGVIAATQKELQELDNTINENRRNTYAEINNNMYYTLTGQNEYTNPFTGQKEIDTGNWNNRWINSSGDIIYTNNGNYNPNSDPDLKIQGFKKSVPGR